MKIARFMVISENSVSFKKVVYGNDEMEIETLRTYTGGYTNQLDFTRDCLENFNNEFPEWDDVLEWTMIFQEDFQNWLDNEAI